MIIRFAYVWHYLMPLARLIHWCWCDVTCNVIDRVIQELQRQDAVSGLVRLRLSTLFSSLARSSFSRNAVARA